MIVSFLVGPSSWVGSVVIATPVKISKKKSGQTEAPGPLLSPDVANLTLQVHPSSSTLFKAPVSPSGFYFWGLCSGRGILPLDNLTENQGDAPISGLHFPTPNRLFSAMETQKCSKPSHMAIPVCQAESLPQTSGFTHHFLEKVAVILTLDSHLDGILDHREYKSLGTPLRDYSD